MSITYIEDTLNINIIAFNDIHISSILVENSINVKQHEDDIPISNSLQNMISIEHFSG